MTFIKIVQTCQGDTLANLNQEGPNVKKQQKYVMRPVKHGTPFRRLDYQENLMRRYLQGTAPKYLDS